MPKIASVHQRVHQEVLTSGLVLAHIGSRAMTLEMPEKGSRLELEDIRKLIALLKRAGVSLKAQLDSHHG